MTPTEFGAAFASSKAVVRVKSLVGTSSARRAVFESAILTLLAATLILVLGRPSYEGVTTLRLVEAHPTGSALTPVAAAKLLLQRAVQQANDPPLASAGAARQFRVDVLRNDDLNLVCRAETSELVQQLCNAAANDVLPNGLTVVTRAEPGSVVFPRLFDAAWPALIVGLGWFLVRRS